jgi:BirA family biotin operon repressor/biotin-[acetyl-CoA-carboxylase] ligase
VLRFDHRSIDSTSLEARRLWQQRNDGEPLLIVAATQTAGIGRLGRSWQSPAGGLWLSVAWPMGREAVHYEGLPLAAGCCVAECLEHVASRSGGRLRCELKWPNDVLVRDHKVAGVLCQCEPAGSRPVLILGVGVNANFSASLLGENLRHPATTLRDELGTAVDLPALRDELASRLQERIARYERGGLAEWVEAIRQRLAWAGQVVEVLSPGSPQPCVGRIRGVDSRGHLLIEDENGVRPLVAGELGRCKL